MDTKRGYSLTDPTDERGRTIRAAIYTRLSADPHGTRLAVQRQEQQARELCERRGWEVVEVFEDDDISAFSGKVRPRYLAMLAELRDGGLDAVVAWHPDRLHRSPRELESFIDIVEKSGAAVATVQGGDYDLSTAGGRMTARVVGAVARHESEHKSERLRAWWRQRHEQGTAYSSNRPFGWIDPQRTAIAPEEAALIREARDRVLVGERLIPIARDWRQRGVVGASGGPATTTMVRNALISAANSGRQEVWKDADGKRLRLSRIVGPATWPAIISADESDRLRSILGDPSRRTSVGRPAGLLLTGRAGVARCGRCGGVLYSRDHIGRAGKRTLVMRCHKPAGGCGRLQITNAPVEQIVSEAVLKAIDGGALVNLLKVPEDREALAELTEVEQQMVMDRADWAAGIITRAEWEKGRGVLQARKVALEKRLERSRRAIGLDGLPTGDLRKAWHPKKPGDTPKLSIAMKRTIIAALVESVVINPPARIGGRPGGRRGSELDRDRVKIHWRG